MASANSVKMKAASNVTITTIVDNYIDNFLPSTDRVKRAPMTKDKDQRVHLLAEHGLSLLVEVDNFSEHHVIALDFGRDTIAMPHNISVLGIDLGSVETFIVSHGHIDHVGAIREILNRLPNPVPVVVHPDAFRENRFFRFPDGREVTLPPLKREAIEPFGCPIVQVESPRLLANGYIATLTAIPRVTDFEKGMPIAYYREGGQIHKDAILDDQGLVIHVQDKGLVVLTGCGHSGIINTILHAQKITGVEKIYAVIGGFHLTGPFFEKVIPRTIEEMKRFKPEFLVPTHCTGWKAMNELEKAFPGNFVLNSVGTKFFL
jgi:7,8-dihydropterin-6-yl-methyl-4-(beta-D-ribofuranosyl)aminobenzene 5'-phosphate synthase